MPELISPTNFDFFARYLLAGFIIMWVRSFFVSGQRSKATEVLFDAVILSLVNQLIFLLLSSSLTLGWHILKLPLPGINDRVIFFFEILVLPALLGVIFGSALARDWHVAFLRRFAMPNVHPTQRAYDYAFARMPGPAFVIATYKDGTQVYGYFGQGSLAATDDQRSDIFLERLYSVNAEGQWTEAGQSRSALLMLDDVRSIEFIPEGGPKIGEEIAR